MIRSRAILVVFLAVATVAAAQGIYTPGQRSSPPAQTGDITLTGKVVNSVTGEGIARALVQISGMQPRATLADASGKFEFDNLPEMQAVLSARKPGYFSDQELARTYRVTPVPVAAGMASVTITLVPAGVIAGHISTPDGDPIEGVFVRLKQRVIQEGRKQWVEHGGARTDENGEFRIANLQPGQYYLFTDGSMRMNGAPGATFAPAYFPGAADISGASPIQVQPGQTFNADLTLQPEKAYRVSGVVTGLPEGQMAIIRVFGSGDESLPIATGVRPDGSFEVPRLPAGTYTLKAMSQSGMGFMGGMGGGPRRVSQTLTATVQVNVSTDLTGVTIPLQPSATIPLSIRTDFSNTQTENSSAIVSIPQDGSRQQFRQYVHLMLRRLDSPGGYGSTMEPGGNMVVSDVEPGRYRVDFNTMGLNVYVQSATFGTTDLLRDDLVITSGGQQQPIEIVLRDDAATITGTADCGGSACWVLVIPDGSAAVPPRQVFVSPAGTFNAAGLPPGNYRVYAFDRLDGLEYTNPDAMKAYDGKAESVSLSAGQKSQVSLELSKVTGE